MRTPLVDRIPFSKIVTVLAVAFGISLGLCGLTFFVSSARRGGAGDSLFVGLGLLELVAMVLSAAGLLLTVVAWVTLAVVSSFQEKVSQPLKLFDDDDDTKLDKKD